MAVARRREADGRQLISRDEVLARTGAGSSTLSYWLARREENGIPEPVRYGRAQYWDEESFDAWWTGFQDAKRAGVTTLDDSGDPSELVDTATVARMLNYAGPGVIIEYLRTYPGYFPEPDHVVETPSGRLQRSWHRRTVWQWARGRGTRTSGRPPSTTASRSGTGAQR